MTSAAHTIAAFALAGAFALTAAQSPAVPGARQLFERAHAGLASEPPLLQPALQARLAMIESNRFPKLARADAKAAFQAALDMSTSGSLKAFRSAMKRQAELESIAALGFARDSQDALRLVAKADVSPVMLYNSILVLGARRASPAVLMPIVNRCIHETGQFPFEGAANLLAHTGLSAADAQILIAQGTGAAASESHSRQFQFATLFLAEVANKDPRAGSQVEDAAAALLHSVAADGSLTINRQTGNQLLQLLHQLDAGRAQELRARYPQFGTKVRPILSMGMLGAPPQKKSRARPAPPSAEYLRAAASSAQDAAARVRYLLAAAGADRAAKDSQQASDDLDSALDAWTPTLPSGLGVSLAGQLKKIGRAKASRSVLQRICASAAARLQKMQDLFPSDSEQDQRATLQSLARGDRAPAALAFAEVARADYALAARHALALTPGYGVSLLLAAVAATQTQPGLQPGR